jgi:RNA polymerase sigma-70 factor (ECF subfamily)
MSAAHLHIVPSVAAPVPDDDWDAVLEGARAGRPRDEERLVERLSPFIERILFRMLGPRGEAEDLCQEVFVRVFDRLGDVREGAALRSFVASVTVFVARESIRARRRRKWLFFLAPNELPEMPLPGFDPVALQTLRAFYAALDRLPANERIVLCLRHIEHMEILEIATATDASASTVKRRLKAAETRFAALARNRPELAWLWTEGSKWPTTKR